MALAVFLAAHAGRGVGGSDSAGYANTARDILAGRLVVPVAGPRELGLDERWTGIFLSLAQEPGPVIGTAVPFYPPGYPLHLAAATVAGGRTAPFFVNPIAAAIALLLMYRLGRELGLPVSFALAGAVILGAWSAFLFAAVEPLSDLTATLWALASVVSALAARRRTPWAAVAGAAFGLAVLVRPTNALMILPVALALPWRPAALGLFGAAGLPFAAAYGVWNRIAFQSPFRTGYTHLFQSELGLSHLVPNGRRYATGLAHGLSVLVPAGGLAGLLGHRPAARDRAMLAVWFAAIFVFYCLWGPSDSWTYLRFMLPAAPALIAGFLLGLRNLADRIPAPRFRWAAAGAVIAAVLVCERREERQYRPLRAKARADVYPEACRELARRANGPAIAVSMDFSAALRFYTDLVPVRWDFLSPPDFEILRERAAEKGWRVLAVVKPYEVADALRHVPGTWVFLGNVRDASLWELPREREPPSSDRRTATGQP